MPTAAGWLPDPSGAHEFRYWDGAQWTDDVSDGGRQGRETYDQPKPPSPPPPTTRPPAPPVVTRGAVAVDSSSISASTDASAVPDEHRLDLSSGWAVVLAFLLATAGCVAAAMAWIVKIKADRWTDAFAPPRGRLFDARLAQLIAAEDRRTVAYWVLAGVFVGFALAAIPFSYWAARRAEAFARAGFRPEWQLWGWLIPVANFILIPVLQTDLWKSYDSEEELQRREAAKLTEPDESVASGRRTRPGVGARPAGPRLLLAAWATLIVAVYLFTKTVITDPAGSQAFRAEWRNHYLHAAWAPTVLALALLFFAGHFLTLKLRIAKRLEELRIARAGPPRRERVAGQE
jgi:Protein of unknown function (DUF2510)/Domain of unknown function (DUF4328)